MNIKSLFGIKASYPPPPRTIGNTLFYPASFTAYAHNSSLIELYNTVPEVQIPVNYIIDSLIALQYRHTRNGEEVANSPVMEMLQTPNQLMNYRNFTRSWWLNRLVLGAAFINPIVPVGFQEATQLYILPTSTTEPIFNRPPNGDFRMLEVTAYRTTTQYGRITISAEDVIADYEAGIEPETLTYKSRLEVAIATLNSLAANYEARVKIYKDRGALGILTPREATVAVGKGVKDKMKEQYFQQFGITGDKMPFLIGTVPMDYTPVTFNSKDLMLLEIEEQDFRTICAIYGLDVVLFDNKQSTYDNKKLAQRNFWENAGIPLAKGWGEILAKAVKLPPNEQLEPIFDDIPALAEDQDAMTDRLDKQYNNGIITREEYREAVGRDPQVSQGTFKDSATQAAQAT